MILEDPLLAMCGFSLSTCLGFSGIVTARFCVDRDGGEDALIYVGRVSGICGTSPAHSSSTSHSDESWFVVFCLGHSGSCLLVYLSSGGSIDSNTKFMSDRASILKKKLSWHSTQGDSKYPF